MAASVHRRSARTETCDPPLNVFCRLRGGTYSEQRLNKRLTRRRLAVFGSTAEQVRAGCLRDGPFGVEQEPVRTIPAVMAGHPGPAFGRPEHKLVPAIHVLLQYAMPAGPAMTNEGTQVRRAG